MAPKSRRVSRLELARAGLHMMEAHPVFGIGLDQFKSVEFHYNPLLAVVEPNPHIAHNTYVQLGAEGGIPTLALYLAILGVDAGHVQESAEVAGRADGDRERSRCHFRSD